MQDDIGMILLVRAEQGRAEDCPFLGSVKVSVAVRALLMSPG